jgi:Protein of unknown function (DUF3800)
VFLQGYVDDSGSDPKDGHFVLAGYVLPADHWARFADAWDAQLKRDPSVYCFKMSDAEYGDGYFKGMREEFRKLKVNELSDVIPPFEPMGLACSVDWDMWKRIVEPHVPAELKNPYMALFYGVIQLVHLAQVHLGGKYLVEFDFDEQAEIGMGAAGWYPALKAAVPEPYKSMMGATPRFLNDEMVLPLQAADMLAWHVHRGLVRPDEQRPILQKITGRFLNTLEYTEEGLNDIAARFSRFA